VTAQNGFLLRHNADRARGHAAQAGRGRTGSDRISATDNSTEAGQERVPALRGKRHPV
jgi:hypothetical protein